MVQISSANTHLLWKLASLVSGVNNISQQYPLALWLFLKNTPTMVLFEYGLRMELRAPAHCAKRIPIVYLASSLACPGGSASFRSVTISSQFHWSLSSRLLFHSLNCSKDPFITFKALEIFLESWKSPTIQCHWPLGLCAITTSHHWTEQQPVDRVCWHFIYIRASVVVTDFITGLPRVDPSSPGDHLHPHNLPSRLLCEIV